MELRKRKEIEHYDKGVKELGPPAARLEFLALGSYKFLYQILRKNCQNKIVLDYGSGSGVHAIEIVKMGAEKVVGIDLSEKSLQVAREKAEKEGVGDRVEFLKMDCEKMIFPENSFDVIFDGGTFSSIDLKLAWPEMVRVLKPGGVLIGIETFGHNPVTNLKRKLNKLTGKRTAWATEHIFRTEDLADAERYFNKIEVQYFHLISWLAFPFLRWLSGKLLLRVLEFFDKILLQTRFFKKYAFKVVFIFST